MRGLITHEESQEVTKAFREKGHEFFSNDIKECSGGYSKWHHKDDVFHCLHSINAAISLDFLGMHPDCTYLTNAGIRWLSSRRPRPGYFYSKEWSDFNGYDTYINPIRWAEMEKACLHFKSCHSWLQTIGKGYIENPRMHPYAMKIIGIPSTQYIHPYYFGTPQMKETHYWLVGLEPLKRTSNIEPPKDKKERLKWQNVWMASPGPKRKEIRSKTDPNVAKAKAEQWG
jgi:hypothetical protein